MISSINFTHNLLLLSKKSKFFIIISKYNYFYSFHHICKYIQEQFLNPKNEIPLEIQIYNLVNFLPCPLNKKIEIKLSAKNGIFNYKTLDEYLNFTNKDKNYTIYLDQLGAFKHSEINMGKIFEIFPPFLVNFIVWKRVISKKIKFSLVVKYILNYFF